MRLSANRVGWKVSTIKEWIEKRTNDIVKSAVTNPDDLTPDDLIDDARTLIAQALLKQHGSTVDPGSVASITVSRDMSEDEFEAAEARNFQLIADRFADIETDRAMILAAWLFAPMRPYIEFEPGSGTPDLSDEVLNTIGPIALSDEAWKRRRAK